MFHIWDLLGMHLTWNVKHSFRFCTKNSFAKRVLVLDSPITIKLDVKRVGNYLVFLEYNNVIQFL